MTAAPHRIRRLRVRARARSREEAFALRARLRDLVGEVVLPLLARMLDELAPGGEVVHVPRLELSAAVREVEDLADVLPELVRREVAAARAPAARAAVGAPDLERRSPGDDLSRAIVRYLETGAFPWHVDAEDAIHAVVADLTAEELARAALACTVERSLAAAVAACFRLLQLVPEPRWPAVARAILAAAAAAEAAPALEAVEVVAALAGASDVSRSRLLRIAATAIAATAIAAARPALAPIDARRVLALLAGTEDAAAARADVEAELERLPPPAAAWLRQRLSQIAAPAPNPTPPTPTSARPAAPPDMPPPATIAGPAAPPPAPTSADPGRHAARPAPELLRRTSAPAAVDPFGIPARHAGLILLHPFLARLFEHTRIKQPGHPALDPPALPRAAALLHTCAVGDAEPFEHELAFVKILLGLPPGAPLLVAGGLLSGEDRDEVDALLRAALDHWAALRRTSAHGLQTTFLRRGGLVREEAQGFRLQVEPAGFDILLASLPWGIATVKLPWMRKPIFTEWAAS